MKKYLKRIVALICSLVVCMSIVPVYTNAATNFESVIAIAKTVSNVSTGFYITGTDTMTNDNWAVRIYAKDAASGILLNGEKVSDAYLQKCNTYDYYVAGFDEAVVNDIVTITGTFGDSSQGESVTFEKAHFLWNGTQWIDYVAPTEYPSVLTIEGSATPSSGTAAFYIKGTDDYVTGGSVDAWAEINMVPSETDEESGVFINKERVTSYRPMNSEGVRLRKYADNEKFYYIEGLSGVSSGTIVTIKGTFYIYDNAQNLIGNSVVVIEDSSFKYDGSKWVDYVAPTEYPSVLTIEGSATPSSGTAAFYIKGTDDYVTGGSVDAWAEINMVPLETDEESGVFINKERVESYRPMNSEGVRLRKYADNEKFYYIEGLSGVSSGTIVTIKGTFYIYDNAQNLIGNSVVVIEDSSFKYDGSKWVDYVEPTKYSGTLTTVGAQVVSQTNSSFYLKGTDEYLSGNGENWNVAYLYEDSTDADSGVWLEDEKLTEYKLQKYDGVNNYYHIDGLGAANVGDVLTIKGTFYSEDGLSAITFEEVKLQYEGNMWINLSTITSYEEGTFWLDTNSPNTATNLHLRGSVDVHENCSPDDYPAFGWETTVGTTGFYKNGVACSGALKNVANGGGWYLGLEGAGITEGDKLTIRGTYGYNGRYVKFAEYNLWYTNGSWVTTAPITSDTQICGDANGDGELNSLDIARLKKHLADEPVSVYKTGADANGVDGVNDRDRIKIYEYILEGAVRKVDGSYVVQYYPVYLDDEDISLGAYHGPRMSGKQDYTYSDGELTSTTVSTNFLNEAEFAKYKAAGLNTLLHEVDGPYSSKAAGLGYGVDDGNFQSYLKLAKQAGLDVYITSMGLNSYVKYEGAGDGATSIDFNGDGTVSTDTITIDEAKYGWDYNGDGTISSSAQMTEIFYYSDSIKNASGMTILEADIRELFDYIVNNGYKDIFKGLAMPDEPWLTGQTRYQSAVTLINKLAAEYGLDIDYQGCVYPSYADRTQIGDTYTTYINGFGTVAGSLMYDFYPLQNTKKWYQSSFTNTLNAAWLTNLQTVAAQGKSNNYTTGITLQSCGYEYAADSGLFANESYRRDPSSDADMQFQVYSALAFGMKTINYFTYWEHPNQSSAGEQFTSSMVQYPTDGGTESVTTNIYTYVQNANAEITKFDHVFMDYDWVETKTNGSSDLFSGLTSTDISGVTVNSYSNASIISHMYDSEKQLDGYWLVNVAEPSGSTTATLNVTFANKNKAIVYINGEEQIVDLTNGVYSASLAVGEGIFIIPLSISE